MGSLSSAMLIAARRCHTLQAGPALRGAKCSLSILECAHAPHKHRHTYCAVKSHHRRPRPAPGTRMCGGRADASASPGLIHFEP